MTRVTFNEIKSIKSLGRSGILLTRAGQVKTPFFMPVATRGSVKGLEPNEVRTSGSQVLLCNTYHLHIGPGEKLISKLGGIHKFTGWNGPILSDSGGFQIFSLAHIRKIDEEGVTFKDPKSGLEVLLTPEKVINIQLKMGVDILMVLDDLAGFKAGDKTRHKEALGRTNRWLERSMKQFEKSTRNLKNKPLIFGIVQGGLDRQLRASSLEFVQSMPVDGIAIGGLSVGESRSDMYEMLDYLRPQYDSKRVHYLMGVGHPADMRYAIERQIDMFDCVLPTRNARHGTVWATGDKKLNLNNQKYSTDADVIDIKCDCTTCNRGYSRAFIRLLFKTDNPLGGRLASIHNLRYLNRLCEGYQL